MRPAGVQKQLYRGFKQATRLPRPARRKGHKLRIVSYNILADKYATGGYAECAAALLRGVGSSSSRATGAASLAGVPHAAWLPFMSA
jgi:hypothetical protein